MMRLLKVLGVAALYFIVAGGCFARPSAPALPRGGAKIEARKLVASADFVPHKSQRKTESNPDCTMAKILELAKLDDDSLFIADTDALENLEDKLALIDEDGMAIAMPTSVDVSKRTELPFLLFDRASLYRIWNARPYSNSLVIVSDIAGGGAWIHDLHGSSKRRDLRREQKSRTGPRPTSSSGQVAVSVTRHNLREIAELPWREGKYAVTLLRYDCKTNTTITTLTRKASRASAAGPTAQGTKVQRPLDASSPREFVVQSAIEPVSFQRPDDQTRSAELELTLPERYASREALDVKLQLCLDSRDVAVHEPVVLDLFFLRRDERSPPKVSLVFPSNFARESSSDGCNVFRVAHQVESLRGTLQPGEYMVVAAFGALLAGPTKLIVE